MVELYVAWSEGLPESAEAVAILKACPLIAGIELIGVREEVRRAQDAGLRLSIHNPLRKQNLSLIDPGKLMDKKMSLMSLANAAVDFVGTPRRSTLWNEATEADTITPTSEEV